MSEKEREARREKLEALRGEGRDPFPARVGPRTPAAEIRRAHDAKDAEALEAEAPPAALVGRVRALRSFGKLLFLTVVEDGTALQVSVRKGVAEPEVFAFARRVDVGDFVRVEGVVWRTKKGELSLDARRVELLAKALRPLPEKWHGLQDVEARYRQRYLDLLANERSREIAVLRSRLVSAVRRFMDGRGFLEVETPVLQPIYGGAAARPFTTHHNALDQTLYLRISDELYLKRLVIGGLDRVYEIGRVFRNEGISHKHNPEFSMLECYQAYADFEDMMALVQALVVEAVETVLGGRSIACGGNEVDLSGVWRRVTIRDAIHEAVGVDVMEAPDFGALRQTAQSRGLDPGDATSWAALVDHLFSEHVEPTLVEPTFVTHHPTELSPLAKRSAEDPRVVERFELYLGGMELANAFSELNDPEEQRARLEGQQRLHAAGDAEAHPMDEDFLRALEHGMPPTGGLGIGIDRLVRVLLDAPNLREVILFPHLRPEPAG